MGKKKFEFKIFGSKILGLNHTLTPIFEEEGTKVKVKNLSKLNTFDLSLV